jgi:hypothetical protein
VLFPSRRADRGHGVGAAGNEEEKPDKEKDKKPYGEQDKKPTGAQVLLVPFIIFQFEIFFLGALASTCLVPYDE